MCESFSCTPLQVLRDLGYELDAVPWLLMTEILEFRSYANTRAAVIRAEERDEVLEGEAAELVRTIRSRVQRARLGLPIF